MSQDDWKFTVPTDLPEAIKAIILKPMIVDGIYGLGCSPDNGITNRIYWTIYGRKFYQEDADRLWPLLIDKVKSVMSVSWDQIQGKPVLVTKGELDQRLSSLDITSVDGLVKQTDLDKLKATLNSNIDASKVSYEQIYPTLINGTTGSVNAFLITLSEKVKMLSFWAHVTLPTIPSWSQVDIMSFPQMYEQNHITLNQSVIPDNGHSLWADFSSTSFSLRNQTGATVSNYNFSFFSSGIFLY